MYDALVESILEAAGLAAETVLFALLTGIGVLSEQIGLADVTSGQTLGYWYVYVGAIALYAGVYLLGYKRLLSRVRDRLTTA